MDEEEETDKEGMEVDPNVACAEGKGQQEATVSNSAMCKDKQPINDKPMGSGESRLRVSKPSLAEGVKILDNPTFETVGVSKQGVQRKTTGKALKDVTNKTVSGPIKFKPYWNGPRFTQGSFKENSNGRRTEAVSGLVGPSSANSNVGSLSARNRQMSARPPDPAQTSYKSGSHSNPQIVESRHGSAERGVRAASTGDGEELERRPEAGDEGCEVGITGKSQNSS